MIDALQLKLRDTNYRIVTSSGDIALKQQHHYIFVMTPERMNYMLTERDDITLSFLFVDEAHKISEVSGRNAYYWKILTQLRNSGHFPTVIFASPNTPNPDLYFDIVPEEYRNSMKQIASKYSPVWSGVCQSGYDQQEDALSYINSLPSADRTVFNYEAQIVKIQEEIERYQKMKLRLYEDLSDGVISKKEYMGQHHRVGINTKMKKSFK